MADVNLAYPTGTSLNQLNETVTPYKIRRRLVDIAEFLAKKGSALAENDVLLAMPIEAGELVKNVTCIMVTAGTASSTATVGDGTDPDGWIKSVTCDSAANVTFNSDGAYVFTQATTTEKPVTWVGGKYYAAADTIDLKLGSTPPQAGQILLLAEVASVVS